MTPEERQALIMRIYRDISAYGWWFMLPVRYKIALEEWILRLIDDIIVPLLEQAAPKRDDQTYPFWLTLDEVDTILAKDQQVHSEFGVGPYTIDPDLARLSEQLQQYRAERQERAG